ncbi:MAG: efflux RND transporter periplasmic adaptor subunit, partial [Burkholderiaceae bacterium]
LLAVIDVPEAEQELLQARAASEQIRARLALTQSSLERWEGLRQRDAVSQQELDERRAAHQQARADLAAAEANVRRLEQLQSFRRVTAPFSGTVVRRNVDVGALIGAGNNGANRELFYLAQTDKLRVDVAVPQTYSAAVIAGQEVTVKLLERPGVPFKGTVARTAGAIDSATRAMQIEISIPNPDGQLMAGAYVEVSLPLANPVKNLLIPVNVLQFRQDGPRVAVVTADAKGEQRIALRNVKLGRDIGRSIEVLGGITPKDALVLNPYDAIEDGERVVAQAAPQEKSDKAQGKQSSGAGNASAPATAPARSDKG